VHTRGCLATPPGRSATTTARVVSALGRDGDELWRTPRLRGLLECVGWRHDGTVSGGPRGQEGVDSPSRESWSRGPGIHAAATLTTERTATVLGRAGILTGMLNMRLIAATGAALNERTIPVGRPVQAFHTLTEVIARDGMDRVRPHASEVDPPPLGHRGTNNLWAGREVSSYFPGSAPER